MSKNPVLEEKTRRLKWLLAVMKNKKREKQYILIAVLEMNFGISKKTAKEYIQTCINAGCFKQEDSEIVFVTENIGM